MPPGKTYFRFASMTRSAFICSDEPIAAIFSPSTKTSPSYRSVAVTTMPLRMRRVLMEEPAYYI